MYEAKPTSGMRNTVKALGIACIILIVSLTLTVGTFTSMVNERDNTIRYQESQIQTLTSQKNQLENQVYAPELMQVNIKSEDVRILFATPYLHVYGEVANIRINPAYNCKLTVKAYQGSVLAIDTYIALDTIDGFRWKTVDSSIYYTGSALDSWVLGSEWTVGP